MTVAGTRVEKLEAAHGDAHRCFTFQFSAPGIDPANLKPDLWTLPGLTVHVNSSIKEVEITQTDRLTEVRYTMPSSEQATTFELQMA